MQIRELTPIEYLALLHIEQHRGKPLKFGGRETVPQHMTITLLEQILAPAVSTEAIVNICNMGLAKNANHPVNGLEMAGTLITTEDGRAAMVIQRRMVHNSIEQAVETHLNRAVTLRGKKTPQESGAKEEERRAAVLTARGQEIRAMQVPVFAEMPLTSQLKHALAGDREFWPGGNPADPQAVARTINEAATQDGEEPNAGELPPEPAPKNKGGRPRKVGV